MHPAYALRMQTEDRSEAARRAARARWGGVKVVIRAPEDLASYVAERAEKRGISIEAWVLRMIEMVRDGKLKEVKP